MSKPQYLVDITTPGLYPEQHFMSPDPESTDPAESALRVAARIWGARNVKLVRDASGRPITR